MRSHSLIADLNAYTTVTLLRKSLSCQRMHMYHPPFFPISFRVSDLMLRSLIHLEWERIRFHFSTCSYPVWLATFVEDTIFSPMYTASLSFKNQMTVEMWFHTQLLSYSIDQWVWFYASNMLFMLFLLLQLGNLTKFEMVKSLANFCFLGFF